MKKSILYIIGVLLLITCKDLPRIDDCQDASGVEITFDLSPCTVPCVKNFGLTNINAIQGATLAWSLAGPSGPISLERPDQSAFNIELREGGLYTISMQSTFPFEGCDFSRSASFQAGVDPPLADLNTLDTSCVVGTCNLRFWQENREADSWTWIIPGTTTDFANQDTVDINFDLDPGSYQVQLIACNLSGCDTASQTIIIEPNTFTLSNDGGLGLEKVIYIKELPNGSYRALVANQNASYTIDVGRDGFLISSTLVTLPRPVSTITEFKLEKARRINNHIIAHGTAKRGSGIDIYAIKLDTNLRIVAQGIIETVATSTETANGVAAGTTSAYVFAGSATGGTQQGLTCYPTDGSLVEQTPVTNFASNAFSQAYDIVNIGSEFLAIGIYLDPTTSSFEIGHFGLDASLSLIPNSAVSFGGNYEPDHLVEHDSRVYMAAIKGSATGVIRDVNSLTEASFSNASFSYSMITSTGHLATVGCQDIGGQQPYLQVLSLPSLTAFGTNNGSFSISSAEFLCVNETSDGGLIMGGTSDVGGSNKIVVVRVN
ncbi:MAG: hypothetical protein AAF242_00275 [Bacteroidota bacterium]